MQINTAFPAARTLTQAAPPDSGPQTAPPRAEDPADVFSPSPAEVDSDSQQSSTGSWLRTGALALVGVAGVAGLAAVTATPAQADTSVDVYIGTQGWGVRIGEGHGHWRGNHGHRQGPWQGNHGHRQGPWQGNHGHHGHYPGPGQGHYPGPWQGPYNHNHGPYSTGYGVDGQVHRFDRYGHVNDGSGHYRLYVDMWGNVMRDYNVNY